MTFIGATIFCSRGRACLNNSPLGVKLLWQFYDEHSPRNRQCCRHICITMVVFTLYTNGQLCPKRNVIKLVSCAHRYPEHSVAAACPTRQEPVPVSIVLSMMGLFVTDHGPLSYIILSWKVMVSPIQWLSHLYLYRHSLFHSYLPLQDNCCWEPLIWWIQ